MASAAAISLPRCGRARGVRTVLADDDEIPEAGVTPDGRDPEPEAAAAVPDDELSLTTRPDSVSRFNRFRSVRMSDAC